MQADTKKIIELLFFLFSAQSIVGQIDMLNMFSIAMSLRIWNTSSRVGAPPNLDNAADTKIVKLLFFFRLLRLWRYREQTELSDITFTEYVFNRDVTLRICNTSARSKEQAFFAPVGEPPS